MPVYCVTGTNRGLGLEFVRQLAREGSNTILALTRSLGSDLGDLRAAAAPSSASVHILECDTGSEDSIASFVPAALKTLGSGTKIDYLINNAGVNLESEKSSLDLDTTVVSEMFRINVVGPQQMVTRLHAAGLLSDSVRVVNVSSGLGSLAETLGDGETTVRHCCGYSMSKAALNMLSVHQSGDLRSKGGLDGAVVIAMDPGWVKTRMGGSGAALEPEESIGGMLKAVRGLKNEDNGRFFQYDGQKKPW